MNPAERLIPLLVFLVAYSFGSYLFLREPRQVANRLFILILLCPFVGDLAHLVLPPLGLPVERVPDASAVFLPALSLHFLAVVGRDAPPRRRLAALHALAVVFYAAQWAVERPDLPFLFAALVVATGAPGAARAYRRLPGRFERARYRIIVAGLALHLLYAAGVPALLGERAGELGLRLFAPLIPVALVGGPILRLRLSNVWLVFRKGFAYGLALALFVAAALWALDELSRAPVPVEAVPPLGAALITLFAVLFQPVMERVRRGIDKLLSPGTYSFRGVTERLSSRLAAILLPAEHRRLALETLAETFRLDRVALVEGAAPGEATFLPEPTPEMQETARAAAARFAPLCRFAARPRHLDELEGESDAGDFPAVAAAAGLRLAVAVTADGKPAWLLLLGPKGGGSDYDDEDLQLIATVASQLSISLQRVEAFRGLREANRKLEETVAELRRAQRELALKERLAVIGRMAATIAHEVRNPLGVMKVAAKTLAGRFPADAQERELAGFIDSEVDKLNRVVSDLLDFTRDADLRRRREPLRAVAEAAVAKAGPQAAGRVGFAVEEEMPGVEAFIHREGMERVLLNLLLNAVEAAGGGVVRIRLRREGRLAVVAVEDEGPGIDPKEAEAVFEPFRTLREGGTGLGLAVCAKIVKAHGGTIRFDLEARRGARVVVALPDPEPPEKESA